MFKRLLPQIEGSIGQIDLGIEAPKYVKDHPQDFRGVRGNPLLIEEICDDVVKAIHGKLGIVGSYGGWMESRSELWRKSYLDQMGGEIIHLGQDFNFPAGTIIAAPQELEVIHTLADDGERHGWGNRIFVTPTDYPDVVLLFAHVTESHYKSGEIIPSGKEFSMIDKSPNNGGWFGHFHLQALSLNSFKIHLKEDFINLDGYGRAVDMARLSSEFPDPLLYLSTS